MGKRAKAPVTTAIRALREAGVDFEVHEFRWRSADDLSALCAEEIGVDVGSIVKTLVFRDDSRNPLLVLMHGNREVSAKELARVIGAKSVEPCEEREAHRHTGYEFGGTSPFGTRRAMPVYVEASVLELPRVYVNGGKRGLIVEMDPSDLDRVLLPEPVRVAR